MINSSQKLFFIVILSLLCFHGISQTNDIDSSQFSHKLDLKDIVHKWIKTKHTKPASSTKNFQWSVYPAAGYSSNTSFAVLGGANALFTVKGASKQSNLVTNLTYTLYNQTLFPFQASVWTRKDKFNIILDDRYINYPSAAYGLRGRSKLDSGYSINFKWIKLHTSVLVKVTDNLYAGVGLFYDYFWKIKEIGVPQTNPNPSGSNTAFEHYVGKRIPDAHETAFGPALRLLYDSRDNPLNAYRGIYFSAIYHPSYKSWGSDTNWSNVVVEARKYFSFSHKKQSVLGLWGYYWQTFGKAAFLLLPSTNWDEYWNTGRGYSQGRYRGSNMRYAEAEYRFQISGNGLIGGVVFSNVQNFPTELYTSYSEVRGRKNVNVTEIGGGLGLRLKFNKYSRTNIALDAGFGQKFPHPWIAVNLGEVF